MAGTTVTLAADGATIGVQVVGPVHLSLTNDFGTGTATFQARDPGGVFVAVANGAFTAATDTLFDYPPGVLNTVRINLTGSSSPDLDIWIQGSNPHTVGI